MHLRLSSLLGLGLSLSYLATASLLTITIPPSTNLPNPHSLPASTHATLTTLPAPGAGDRDPPHILTASLTRGATLVFRDLPAGHPETYLLDIRAGEYVFAPYRVDVAADGSVTGIWETFRGNPWENRGAQKYVVDVVAGEERRPETAGEDVLVEAKLLGKKAFYEERASFSPLSLLKNPMILMAVVALVLTFGMPKLMENMDPEMRAEFEQQSRSSPLTGATNNAIAGGGFDLAGWMAGTAPSPMAVAQAREAQERESASGREAAAAGNVKKRG
ncbi:hypothetical protein N7539_000705 [Penicillium diatomitis]|uniref:ER membrane protein complex subunit 7 beta-sandwich domain-containing protein n=1 Tax=Penicillium diatomitis TaxID=2819901 RepID=A0A9W9XNP8_9EURO|nr:uncharacterized protein N7539_000705 [Penicillium diatomitis]KAJ5495589.1 hypothetical protein N7539_000705 [Penicillium diatomitis]